MDEYFSFYGVNCANFCGDSWEIFTEIFELPAQGGTNNNPGYGSSAPVDASGYPSEVVRLTNAQRAGEGLPELAEDAQLMEMAAVRAQELALQVNHTAQRTDDDCLGLEEIGAHNAREIIGSGYKSPQHVVGGCLDSSGYRANILKKRYTQMGVGCCQDPNALITYWVQLFATQSAALESTSIPKSSNMVVS